MGKWSDTDRAHALDLLRDGNTPAQASDATGIPKRTIADWAKAAGITTTTAQARAKTEAARAHLALTVEERRAARIAKLNRIADLAADLELDILADDERPSLRDVVGARTRAIHDAELLAGRATSRTESVTQLDAELEELTAALAGNDAAVVEADG